MRNGQRVLVVDGLSETEQVLKAVLEPRGLQVDRVRGDRDTRLPQDSAPPNVVVIHEDETPLGQTGANNWNKIPRVIIGSAEILAGGEHVDGQLYLRKPFQYHELIQAIERLLAEPSP